MKYFRDGDAVYAFEADGSQDEFIPEGAVVMAEADVLAHLHPVTEPRAQDVDLERDRRIDAGITFGDVIFQSRSTDRENISGAAQLGFMALSEGAAPGDLRWNDPENDFAWIAADNSLVPMDAQTAVALGKAAAQHKQALIFAARQLKDMDPIPADYINDKWWP